MAGADGKLLYQGQTSVLVVPGTISVSPSSYLGVLPSMT
jgi:hypothetical protein